MCAVCDQQFVPRSRLQPGKHAAVTNRWQAASQGCAAPPTAQLARGETAQPDWQAGHPTARLVILWPPLSLASRLACCHVRLPACPQGCAELCGQALSQVQRTVSRTRHLRADSLRLECCHARALRAHRPPAAAARLMRRRPGAAPAPAPFLPAHARFPICGASPPAG